MVEMTAADPNAAPETGHAVDRESQDAAALVLSRHQAASREREEWAKKWERWRRLFLADPGTIPEDRQGLNNVFDPALFEIAQTQIPRLMQAWFGERPMFPLKPRGNEDKERADDMSTFLQSQIDANALDPETSAWIAVDGGVVNFTHYGTMWMHISWDGVHERPVIECPDMWEFFPDPMAQKGYALRYCIRSRKTSVGRIQELAKSGFYDQKAVDKFLEGTAVEAEDSTQSADLDTNPDRQIDNMPDDDRNAADSLGQSLKDRARLDKPVDVWEYSEPDRLIHMLDRRTIVHDGPSPYDLKEIPSWAIPLVPTNDRLYGVGNAEIGERLQLEINSKTNQALDNADILLNPVLKVLKHSSFDARTSKFEPGGQFYVDNMDDVQPLHLPNYLLGTSGERKDALARLNQGLGTTDYTKGQQGSDRIGVVVRLLIEQANARYGMLAQRFFEYGIRKWYKWSVALNLQFIGKLAQAGETTSWERTMEGKINPFLEVLEKGGTVEDLMRDLIMPQTYFTGSKALRVENILKLIEIALKYEPLATQYDWRQIAAELPKVMDIPGGERLLVNPDLGVEQQVADENERLMLGERIAPRQGELHEAHLEGHMAAVAALDSVIEGMDEVLAGAVREAFTVHLRGTQLLAQQEAEAEGNEGQPPGPAPDPKIAGARTQETEPQLDVEDRAANTAGDQA